MSNVTSIVRSIWDETKLTGHLYCRRAPGAYQDAWIIHHGKNEPEGTDTAKRRFVARCRKALVKEGLDRDVLIFQLEDYFRSDLNGLLRMAWIAADRIPQAEWPDGQGWKPVCCTGDSVEMWDKAVERKGKVYRVIIGSYDTWRLDSNYRDKVMYVGGRRGAMVYSDFR
ncbi:MAG: hypothetical protein RBU30_12630 [Polyangia bacterium]|jgi:hypothetical protein|nr:hypothetical protein [Polyangia bacterium]